MLLIIALSATPFTSINRWVCELVATGKKKSASYSDLVTFGYVESQKATTDERSWVTQLAEADIKINAVSLSFILYW